MQADEPRESSKDHPPTTDLNVQGQVFTVD